MLRWCLSSFKSTLPQLSRVFWVTGWCRPQYWVSMMIKLPEGREGKGSWCRRHCCIWRELCTYLWTSIISKGICRRGWDDEPLASPFRWALPSLRRWWYKWAPQRFRHPLHVDSIFVLDFEGSPELVMGRNVLEHVDHAVRVNTEVIDSNCLHSVSVGSSAGYWVPSLSLKTMVIPPAPNTPLIWFLRHRALA